MYIYHRYLFIVCVIFNATYMLVAKAEIVHSVDGYKFRVASSIFDCYQGPIFPDGITDYSKATNKRFVDASKMIFTDKTLYRYDRSVFFTIEAGGIDYTDEAEDLIQRANNRVLPYDWYLGDASILYAFNLWGDWMHAKSKAKIESDSYRHFNLTTVIANTEDFDTVDCRALYSFYGDSPAKNYLKLSNIFITKNLKVMDNDWRCLSCVAFGLPVQQSYSTGILKVKYITNEKNVHSVLNDMREKIADKNINYPISLDYISTKEQKLSVGTKTAEAIGGKFKAYAAIMFYQRVEIEFLHNKGVIEGFYGIAAACPIPLNGKLDNVIDKCGLATSIINDIGASIKGKYAAIDIDCGDALYTKEVSLSIKNNEDAYIYGSIILPNKQIGFIENSGHILPYTDESTTSYMIIKARGISFINNKGGNIVIDKLDIDTKKFSLINSSNFTLNGTLTINYMRNYGNMIVNNFDVDFVSSKKLENHFTIVLGAGVQRFGNFINFATAEVLGADASTVILDNKFDNKGLVSSNNIVANDFINNGTLKAMSSITGTNITNKSYISNVDEDHPLSIKAPILNNDTTSQIKFFNVVTISEQLINNGYLLSTNAILVDATLENNSLVELKGNIETTYKGVFKNNKNSELRHSGVDFRLNPGRFNFINTAFFNIESTLILLSDFTNESRCHIETINSEKKLINTTNAECSINYILKADIKNNTEEVSLTINNIIGTCQINKFTPINIVMIKKTGNCVIDNLYIPKDKRSSIHNKGTLTVTNNGVLDRYSFINYGHFIGKNKITILKSSFPNVGYFEINKLQVKDNFIFENMGDNAEIKFTSELTNRLQIINSGLLYIEKPIDIKFYQGKDHDDIRVQITKDTDNNKAFLMADSINFYAYSISSIGNNRSRLIIELKGMEVSDIDSDLTYLLVSAKKIQFPTKYSDVEMLLYGDTHNLPTAEQAKLTNKANMILILLAKNIKLQSSNISGESRENISSNLTWHKIPGYFLPECDSQGIYSMAELESRISGKILYQGSKADFKITSNGGLNWYVDESTLHIGRASKQSASKPIEVKNPNSTVKDAFLMEALKPVVSAGCFMISNDILTNGADINAFTIVGSAQVDQEYLRTDCPKVRLWLINKFIIDKNANVVAGKTKSAIKIRCFIEQLNFENYGMLTGGNGINILGPSNYINGTITNYGIINADLILKTNMSIKYQGDTNRKLRLINKNQMSGGFNLGGYGCELINAATIEQQHRSQGITAIYGEETKIHNTSSGYMNLLSIKLNDQVSSIKVINEGNMIIANDSIVNNLDNRGYFNAKGALAVVGKITNSDHMILNDLKLAGKVKILNGKKINLTAELINNLNLTFLKDFEINTKFSNSGTMNVNFGLLKISNNNFDNLGIIHATNTYIAVNSINNRGVFYTKELEVENNLSLSANGYLKVNKLKAADINNAIKIYDDTSSNSQLDLGFADSRLSEIIADANIKLTTVQFNNNLNITGKVSLQVDTIKTAAAPININIVKTQLLTSNLLIDSKNPLPTNLSFNNSGVLALPCFATLDHYQGNKNSHLIIKLYDFAKENQEITQISINKPLLYVTHKAMIDTDSTITIQPTGNVLRDNSALITILKADNLCDQNNIGLTKAAVTAMLTKQVQIDSVLLKVEDINVSSTAITAKISLEDKERLGDGSLRRTHQTLLTSMLGSNCLSKDNNIPAAGFIYNHYTDQAMLTKPPSLASITWAYTDNMVVSPVEVHKYGLSFDSLNFAIKSKKKVRMQSYFDSPALIIGTQITKDKFFHDFSATEVSLTKITIDNIILDGSQRNHPAGRADADGLLITGNNKLILTDGIEFKNTIELLAGASHHALHVGVYIIGSVTNDAIIGNKFQNSGIYFSQPMEGTFTNNNLINGRESAIKFEPLTNYDNNKSSLTIINNANIMGSIQANFDVNIHWPAISLINNSRIVAGVISGFANSNENSLYIYNNKQGVVEITDDITINQQYFFNEGVLNANKLNLSSDYITYGSITAKYLNGNKHQLTADHLAVGSLQDIHVVNKLQVSAEIKGIVTSATELLITGIVKQQGSLTTSVLHFATDSYLENTGFLKIDTNKITLSNSILDNKGILEVSGTIKLSGDMSTKSGSVKADEIFLDGHTFQADNNSLLSFQHLNNIQTGTNTQVSKIILNNQSQLKLGFNSSDVATINGMIELYSKSFSFYAKLTQDGELVFNQDLHCQQANLRLGSLFSPNKNIAKVDISNNATINFSKPVIQNNIAIINSGNLELPSESKIHKYIGNGSITVLLTKINDRITSLLTANTLTFSADSSFILKPDIDVEDCEYTQVELIKTKNPLLYKQPNGTLNNITESEFLSLLNHEDNNYRIIRLTNLHVEHKPSGASIVSAYIGIRNIANFKDMVYVDQYIDTIGLGKCNTEVGFREGIAWEINKQNNILFSNNLIITPYKLVDQLQQVSYAMSEKNIYCKAYNANNIIKCMQHDTAAVVIGSEITTTDKSQHIVYNNNAQLNLNNIYIDDINIDGSLYVDTVLNKIINVNQDGLLIRGNHLINMIGVISIDKKSVISAGTGSHAMHLAAPLEGNINNAGVIGGNNTGYGLYISNFYSGTITNDNKIEGAIAAVSIEPRDYVGKNNAICLVNNGIILGSILTVDKKISSNKIDYITIANNNVIANNMIKDSSKLPITINNNASSNLHAIEISVTKIINHGSIVSEKIKYTTLENYASIVIQDTNCFFINAKFKNEGSLTAVNIKQQSDFTNNGIIDATDFSAVNHLLNNDGFITAKTMTLSRLINNKSAQIHADDILLINSNVASKNSGTIITNKISVKTPIVNDGILRVEATNSNFILTTKITNNGTLEFVSDIILLSKYNNNGFIIAEGLHSNNKTINNTKSAIIKCSIIEDISVNDGLLILTKYATGTNNISNLLLEGNVTQYGKLTANNIDNRDNFFIYGSVSAKTVQATQIENRGILEFDDLNSSYDNSIIDNFNYIKAKNINNCQMMISATATTIVDEINNSIIINNGKFIVNNNIKNEVAITGGMHLAKSAIQEGSCVLTYLTGNKLKIKGDMHVNDYVAVNSLTNNGQLYIGKLLTVNKNNNFDNSGSVTVHNIELNGKLINRKNSIFNITEQHEVILSNKNFENHGELYIANELYLKYEDFTNNAKITAGSLRIAANCKLINNGLINIISDTTCLLSNKNFKNKGTANITGGVELTADLINDNIFTAKHITGGYNLNKFTNKKQACFQELDNIIIVNNGDLKVTNKLTGNINITGGFTCSGLVEQSGILSVDNINYDTSAAESCLKIQINSVAKVTQVYNTKSIDVINYGSLHLQAGSKLKSYEARGGSVYLYLTDELSKVSAPLLNIEATASFAEDLTQMAMIVLKPKVMGNIGINNKKRITILSAKNIMISSKAVTNDKLHNILAMQTSVMAKDAITSDTVLLAIANPQYSVSAGLCYVNADVYWKTISDLTFLTEKPITLSAFAQALLAEKQSVDHKKYLHKIKSTADSGSIPAEAYDVAVSLSKSISTTEIEKLPLPDNSIIEHEIATNVTDTAMTNLKNRLAMDRSPRTIYNKIYGINSGNLYTDICMWSSFSLHRNIENSDDKYANTNCSSRISNFGIDNQFTKSLKVGFMFANIESTAKSVDVNFLGEYSSYRNYNISTYVNTVYLDYNQDSFYINSAILFAKARYNQQHKSSLPTAEAVYNASVLGLHTQIIYPYVFGDYSLELVNIIKLNSIVIPTYKLNNYQTKYSSRITTCSLGLASHLKYAILINHEYKLNIGCNATCVYTLSLPLKNKIKVNYFENDIICSGRSLSKYDIKFDVLACLAIYNKIMVAINFGYGIKSFSKYTDGKLEIKYQF